MGFGKLGFSSAGDPAAPSGSIWGDSPNALLEELGYGYFTHEEFLGGPVVNTTITSALLARLRVGHNLSIDGDDDTVLIQKAAELGGYQRVETDGDDNDAVALFTAPLGKIVRNSGNKVWFEQRIELATLFDGGVFVGLTTEANANRDLIADNPSTSAQAGLTAATVVGFVTQATASAISQWNAVYSKGAAAPVLVLANVTNSTQLTSAAPPGIQPPVAAALAAATEVKLGVYFNGRDSLSFYVNGYKVASVDVDVTVDQTSNLVAVFAQKTGSAAAAATATDWLRSGASARH